MGKKKIRKHQKEPNESSHSSDEDNNEAVAAGKCCPHVLKSVQLTGVKRALKNGVIFGRCETCHDNLKSDIPVELQPRPDEIVVWMCLNCGYQGCGRYSDTQHALLHYKTPHSDSHCLVTNTSSWDVWCYECDNDVNVESNKKLLECVNFIQRQMGMNKGRQNKTPDKEQDEVTVNGAVQCKENGKDSNKRNAVGAKSNPSAKDAQICRVKGLRNLGNTCFFNAIMQSLSRCHWLANALEEFCCKGAKMTLLGYIDSNDKVHETNACQLGSLELTLYESGPLTISLLDFFREMHSPSSKGTIVNPNQVLGQICKKAPQFRGSRQQDSHELLRHLIDGVRTEEIKRQKTAILKVFNLYDKIDPKTVDENLREKIRGYGRLANHTIVDWLFSGQLISTVLCQECQMASQIFEPFLDLSLPVTEEKPLRPGLHKRSSVEDASLETFTAKNDKPSRYQEKKAKRLAKKEAKRNKGKKLRQNSEEKNGQNEDESGSEESDADVEDNAESEAVSLNEAKVVIVAESNSFENVLSFDPSCSKEDDLCARIGSIALENGDCRPDSAERHQEPNLTDCEKMALHRQRKQEWIDKSLVLLAPRYHPASHECSVLSCLNQFTAPELLTGNNKFGCENCTKIRQEKCQSKTGKKSEIVYSNASKQLLIFSPPAVLTLHLKRFQQVGHTLRKVNRHVEFPLILDLAPFCSSICVNLPNMQRNQSQVLYSLFGVVEHSGRLATGHYTAYVKVRAKEPVPRHFLNLKPASQYDINRLVEEMTTCADKETLAQRVDAGDSHSCNENGQSNSSKLDCKKWYYVSDQSVSEVPEQSVLQSQAYILFYERIL